jgi:threonine synthase
VNVGRLLPQALYYVHAASILGWDDAPATYVVPSGNLGSLCAGLLAKRAGMPARSFIAATNQNRVFPSYLQNGVFAPVRPVPTLSNAMDVGDPSNLERLRWLYDDDIDAVRRDVRGVTSDDEETRRSMTEVHRRTGYLLDPHTAVAWSAMEKTRKGADTPWVILATAHPAKFPEIVHEATGVMPPTPDRLAALLAAPERFIELAAESGALRALLLEGADG